MLGGIWQFLKDPANFAVLGSIGAVIAAIVVAAWNVFTYFAKKSEKEAKQWKRATGEAPRARRILRYAGFACSSG